MIVGLGPRILTSTVGDNSEVFISKFDFKMFQKFRKMQPLVWNVFWRFESVAGVGESRFIPIVHSFTLSYEETRFS